MTNVGRTTHASVRLEELLEHPSFAGKWDGTTSTGSCGGVTGDPGTSPLPLPLPRLQLALCLRESCRQSQFAAALLVACAHRVVRRWVLLHHQQQQGQGLGVGLSLGRASGAKQGAAAGTTGAGVGAGVGAGAAVALGVSWPPALIPALKELNGLDPSDTSSASCCSSEDAHPPTPTQGHSSRGSSSGVGVGVGVGGYATAEEEVAAAAAGVVATRMALGELIEETLARATKLVEFIHTQQLWDGTWDLSPIYSGHDIQNILPSALGPVIGQAMEAQIRWMLQNPAGTKEECKSFLQLSFSQNASPRT
jgi:hypothetical protein